MEITASKKIYKLNKNNRYYRIRANVIGSKLIHLSGFHSDYVEYYIKIETDYANWTLKKRYEDISKLNNKLKEIIPEINKLFPPKRIFKSIDSIIGERIKLFNIYFNYLFCNINIFLIEEIMTFISLKKRNNFIIHKKIFNA